MRVPNNPMILECTVDAFDESRADRGAHTSPGHTGEMMKFFSLEFGFDRPQASRERALDVSVVVLNQREQKHSWNGKDRCPPRALQRGTTDYQNSGERNHPGFHTETEV